MNHFLDPGGPTPGASQRGCRVLDPATKLLVCGTPSSPATRRAGTSLEWILESAKSVKSPHQLTWELWTSNGLLARTLRLRRGQFLRSHVLTLVAHELAPVALGDPLEEIRRTAVRTLFR